MIIYTYGRQRGDAGATVGPSERQVLLNRFDEEFQVFRSHFSRQTLVFFRTIKAASKSVLREPDPVKPGVILLVGSDPRTLECTAQRIASLNSVAYGSGTFRNISIQAAKLDVGILHLYM